MTFAEVLTHVGANDKRYWYHRTSVRTANDPEWHWVIGFPEPEETLAMASKISLDSPFAPDLFLHDFLSDDWAVFAEIAPA